MIPVIVTEIKDWYKNFRRRTLLIGTGLLTITAIITMARPEICLVIFLIFILFTGYLSGRESWNNVIFGEWIIKMQLKSYTVMAAKLLGVICIGIIHIIILLPVWIYMDLMWGVGWQKLVIIFINILIAMAVSTSFSLIGNLISLDRFKPFKDKDTIIGPFYIVLWLAITALPVLRLYNPFFQIYIISFDFSPIKTCVSIIINFVFIFLLIMLFSFIVKKSQYALEYYLEMFGERDK